MCTSLVLATPLLTPISDIHRLAEDAGIHRVWFTEYQGRDAIVRAVACGAATERIGVGTGIAYGFTRAPLALAASALDAQEISGGRFVLGLGAGTRGLRRAYGVEWEAPATRLAELVADLRTTWALPAWERPVPPPPIALAGVNEAMLRVAAHHGDRVVLHPLCLVETHLAERVLPAIEAGTAKRTNRRPAVSAWCIASVGNDGDRARASARRQLAFYLSTPGYRTVFEGTSFEATARSVRDDFATGSSPDWEALSRHVPDDLLDQVAVAGTASEVSAAAGSMVQRLAAQGVDEIVYQTVDVGADPVDVFQGIRRVILTLAPDAAAEEVTP